MGVQEGTHEPECMYQLCMLVQQQVGREVAYKSLPPGHIVQCSYVCRFHPHHMDSMCAGCVYGHIHAFVVARNQAGAHMHGVLASAYGYMCAHMQVLMCVHAWAHEPVWGHGRGEQR